MVSVDVFYRFPNWRKIAAIWYLEKVKFLCNKKLSTKLKFAELVRHV